MTFINSSTLARSFIAGAPKQKQIFPPERREQAGCVLDLLGRSQTPLTPDQLVSLFKEGDRIKPQIQEVITSLNWLGQIETFDEGRSFVRVAS